MSKIEQTRFEEAYEELYNQLKEDNREKELENFDQTKREAIITYILENEVKPYPWVSMWDYYVEEIEKTGENKKFEFNEKTGAVEKVFYDFDITDED